MTLFTRALATLAACCMLSFPATADSGSATQAERFVQALQQQRFDEAAAMFERADAQSRKAGAAQLQRIAARIGGFSTMRQLASLPSGSTLTLEVPADALRQLRPTGLRQLVYTATAADGQPVFYVLALGDGQAPQPALSFHVHLPIPDAPSRQRAEQTLAGIR